MGFRIAPVHTLSLATLFAVAAGAIASASVQPTLSQPAYVRQYQSQINLHLRAHSVAPPNVPVAIRPDHARSFVTPASSGKAQVFVSDFGIDDVFGFDPASGKVLTFLTGFSNPTGLATDKAGNLYVANTTGNDIVVLKPPYNKVIAILPDPGQYPVDVAVDPGTGVIAVTNLTDTSGGPGSVSFYKNLYATKPGRTVYNSNWAQLFYGAFDAHGDFFVDGLDSSSHALVGVVQGELHALTITQLVPSSPILYPGGVQVTPDGYIAVLDSGAQTIYTVAAPTSLNMLRPFWMTFLSGSGVAASFAFNTGTAAAAWTAGVNTTSLPNGTLYEYRYPVGGSAQFQYSGFSLPLGLAYNHPAIP